MNVHIIHDGGDRMDMHVPIAEAFPDAGDDVRAILENHHATTLRVGGGAAPEVIVVVADSPNGIKLEELALTTAALMENAADGRHRAAAALVMFIVTLEGDFQP